MWTCFCFYVCSCFDFKNNFRFATLTKHGNNQTNCRTAFEKLMKIWICLVRTLLKVAQRAQLLWWNWTQELPRSSIVPIHLAVQNGGSLITILHFFLLLGLDKREFAVSNGLVRICHGQNPDWCRTLFSIRTVFLPGWQLLWWSSVWPANRVQCMVFVMMPLLSGTLEFEIVGDEC
jgi:hypothetical protein